MGGGALSPLPPLSTPVSLAYVCQNVFLVTLFQLSRIAILQSLLRLLNGVHVACMYRVAQIKLHISMLNGKLI